MRSGRRSSFRRREVTPTESGDLGHGAHRRPRSTINCSVVTRCSTRRCGRPRNRDTAVPPGVPYLLKDLAAEAYGAGLGDCDFSGAASGATTPDLSRLAKRTGHLWQSEYAELGLVPTCKRNCSAQRRNPWDVLRFHSRSSGGSLRSPPHGARRARGTIWVARYGSPRQRVVCRLKPTRARDPFGPEYGDVISGWAVEHALAARPGQRSAAGCHLSGTQQCLCPSANGATIGTGGRGRYRRSAHCLRRARTGWLAWACRLFGSPGGCGHAVHVARPRGCGGGSCGSSQGRSAPRWGRCSMQQPPGSCALGSDGLVASRGLTIEPIRARLLGARAERVSAAAYLGAIETLQRFSRRVAEFLTGFNLWLTPTMSTPRRRSARSCRPPRSRCAPPTAANSAC